MKVWGILALAAAAGCAATVSVARMDGGDADARRLVDRLRVEAPLTSAPHVNGAVASFIELPPGAYVAQGWWWTCSRARPVCEPDPSRRRRRWREPICSR